MDYADILAQVPLFAPMKKRELKKIAEAVEELAYEPGEMVITEGERDARLFVLLEGEVEVIKGLGQPGQRLLARLGPGVISARCRFGATRCAPPACGPRTRPACSAWGISTCARPWSAILTSRWSYST